MRTKYICLLSIIGTVTAAAPRGKGVGAGVKSGTKMAHTDASGGELMDEEDWEPRVEIRLSPPKHPLPEVSGKIELLDRSRKLTEERLTTKLLRSYDDELVRSRKLITALIRRAMEEFDDPAVIPPKPPKNAVGSSFFDLGDNRERPGRIWVSVEESPAIDGTVIKRIESIERKNSKKEFSLFQTAVDDMHEVTRFTLQQLNESLTNIMRPVINTTDPVSFIDLSPVTQRCQELQLQFGTHLVPSCDITNATIVNPRTHHDHAHAISVFADEHTYPTVESLVQDMLKRREVDEQLFRARSLALMARLAQEQSKIAQDLLQSAVASITVQYRKVIRAVNMTRDEQKQYAIDHPRQLSTKSRRPR